MDEEGGDSGGATAPGVKGKVINQSAKKGLIQNSIPILIELKKLLENKNSSLINSLMECLRAILKDYKNEIDDMLVADKQLQKELFYDMQRYESGRGNPTTAADNVQRSETCRSPGDPKDVNGSTMRKKNNTEQAAAGTSAVAATIARSVLRDANRGGPSTPLGTMSVPRLKTSMGGASGRGKLPQAVIESVRKMQTFDSDDEN